MAKSAEASGVPERICVRAPNWVGDVVMATPLLRALREHFARAHIAVVVHGRVGAVLKGEPWFDELIAYEPRLDGAMRAFLRTAAKLRRGRYDLGFVLPNSFSSALMFRLGGVRRRIGYARDGRSMLLSDAVPRPSEDGRFKPTYMVRYYLSLAERVGVTAADTSTSLHFTEADERAASAILRKRGVDEARALFLLHPGAGFGPSKRWPASHFSRLAELLHETQPCQVAVIAGPAEAPTVGAIVRGARSPVIDLSDCGIDLHLLKCVVARSGLLVTTDSGPRHYGVALGVPTVCVMGPTHPGYSTSDRPNDHVVRLDVPCGPCQRKVCPLDHRCMEEISPELVFEACLQALSFQRGAEGR